MGEVFFYHLTRRPLEVVLPALIERALQAGWRVAVRGTEAARLDWLDDTLWLGPEDRFLPHGRAGGRHDARQPVLLTTDAVAANDAACVMCIDGADVAAAEVSALNRVCILFDGSDDAAVTRARAQWRSLCADGCAAQYWSEDSGRWEKKAQSGSAGAE